MPHPKVDRPEVTSRMVTSRLLACSCAVIALLIGVGVPSSPAGAVPQVWTNISPVNPAKTVHNNLAGVSCVQWDDCYAVGSAAETVPYYSTLAEHWNGADWSAMTGPIIHAVSALNAISCTGDDMCMAVGDTGTTTALQTLAELWNGAQWSIVPTPNTTANDYLVALSCTGPSFCMATGNVNYSGVPFVETWNGSSWSVGPSPDPSAGLSSVSCTDADTCVAVGSAGELSASQNVAEIWNGSTWSLVPTPDPGVSNQLDGVDCIDGTTGLWCIAVGTYTPSGANSLSLAEEWEDGAWTVVPSADITGTFDQNSLASVSCTGATDCVAAGYAGTGGTVQGWDGSSFNIVASADDLYGVSCVTVENCMAVGHSPGKDTLTSAIDGAPVAFPSISSFAPKKAPVGKKVTITGTNLAGATQVTFGGIDAAITSDSADSLTAQVPLGAKSGVISVTTPGGTAISRAKFKVKK